MSKLEILKMLVLSTGHLTEDTAMMLAGRRPNSNPVWLPAFTRDEGWMFYVGDGGDGDRYKDAPRDLRDVMNFARHQKVEWVMFDRDGEFADDLMKYDW